MILPDHRSSQSWAAEERPATWAPADAARLQVKSPLEASTLKHQWETHHFPSISLTWLAEKLESNG